MSGDHADPAGTSRTGGIPPSPPRVPTSLADAIAALVNATTENSRLMREIAQNQQGDSQGGRDRRGHQKKTTYATFIDTKPPVFSQSDEPLQADDWLRSIEHKFELITCTETQKPLFAAQQLRNAAGA